MPAERAPDTTQLTGAARREAMTRNLYDLMARMYFRTQPLSETLWGALLDAAERYGARSEIIEDARRTPMTYRSLITNVYALSSRIGSMAAKGEPVGLMLPTGLGAVVAFFALQAAGRVTAMLNYSSGSRAIESAVESAGLKTVVTSREFIEKANLQDVVSAIERSVMIIYLEDIRDTLSVTEKLSAFVKCCFGFGVHKNLEITTDSTAVILFTSGSEGTPKGVALTHRNLLSNVNQIRTVIAYSPKDIIFNALPIFHAFGLVGGVLVPTFHGTRSFLHPTPLQYRAIPELIYHSNATIVFGTDTFLNGWAKSANSYDFYNVRMVVAGAEKLRDSTRTIYAERFGVTIYEGYGASECSPVVSLNSPMFHKDNTVGRLLPGIDARLSEIEGIEHGALLAVHGPNIFQGYYRSENPGHLDPITDGWYDTGDVVTIDDEGFLKIEGRAKRFAKIGGEMVSLNAVEAYAYQLWPKAEHAVINLPDPRKGEKIFLVTTEPSAASEALTACMRAGGASELSIPKDVILLTALPTLGSGKTDYVQLQKLYT